MQNNREIEANIASEHYFTAAHGMRGRSVDDPTVMGSGLPESLTCLTFCVLVLRNGFTVTGESVCSDRASFNFGMSSKVARENAVQKVRLSMGTALTQQPSDQ